MAALRDALLKWPQWQGGRAVLLLVGSRPATAEKLLFLASGLVGNGFEFRATSSTLEAMRAARRFRTVLLLDVALGSDRVVRFLRSLQAYREYVPVVALGRREEEGLIVEALDAGAADYLIEEELSVPLLSRVLRYCLDRERIRFATRRVYQESRRQENRVRALLFALPHGAAILDPEGRVRMANERCGELSGRALEWLESHTVEEWGWQDLAENSDGLEVCPPAATLRDGYARVGRVRILAGSPDRRVEVRVDVMPLFEHGRFRPTGAVLLLEELSVELLDLQS
jgi:DNA-binding response OmpR family regulator